jgi:hypothetical protein
MRRISAGLVFVALSMALAARGRAQQTICPYGDASSSNCIFFTMERFGVMVPAYTMVVLRDGALKYWENTDPRFPGVARLPWLKVSDGTTRTLVAAEASIRSGACMSHTRAMGFGGKATMIAWSAEGYVACSFSTSNDASVSDASATFQAIAAMIQGGEKLERDHHGDRLGLESDLDGLAGDDAIIDRVRQKAAGLLQPAVPAAPRAR